VGTAISELPGVNAAYNAVTSLAVNPAEDIIVAHTLELEAFANDLPAYEQVAVNAGDVAKVDILQTIKDKTDGVWTDLKDTYKSWTDTVSGVKIPGTSGVTISEALNYANTYSVEVKVPWVEDGVQQYAINPDTGAPILNAAGQKIPLERVVLQQFNLTDLVAPIADKTVMAVYTEKVVTLKAAAANPDCPCPDR
jgi:hypothetical protein